MLQLLMIDDDGVAEALKVLRTKASEDVHEDLLKIPVVNVQVTPSS